MLPMDVFIANLTSPVREDNAQDEILDAVFLAVGERAKEYISEIVTDGAEMVLDEILRDTPDSKIGSQVVPDETTHERLDDEDHVIFWSKSGVEPFVGVYKKTNPNGNDVERTGEPEMLEEPIKEIDMEAVEAASHFLLRGIDEDTVNRVISDACKDCYHTEEAINKIRDLITEDPRLSGYALDEDEIAGLNEYRHKLRKSFLGSASPDVINQSLYEGEEEVELAKAIATDAEQDLEDAEDDAEREADIDAAKSEVGLDGDEDDNALFEKTDPNKGSQTAGFRHSDGPQALANAISQMEWSGPGSSFDLFLNEITVDGYNMLGAAASGKDPMNAAPDDNAAMPEPEAPAPAPEVEPAMTEPEAPSEEPDLADL